MDLLNEREAAKVLRISVQLLRKWRANGAGPQLIKLGKCVRYSSDDIEQYISSQRSATVPGAGHVTKVQSVQ